MKVLIVDDHVLFRDGLVSMLRAEPGFEVVGQAGTVSEAIELALKVRPELILMDFGLPDGTGVEATRAILAELPECKIVFLTAFDADETLFSALRQGAAGYLLKNLPIEELLANLRGLERGEAAISKKMTARVLKGLTQSMPVDRGECAALDGLSPRELAVLKVLVGGLSNREIADRLFLSVNTVKRHVNSILSKLQLPNRSEAARFARRCGVE